MLFVDLNIPEVAAGGAVGGGEDPLTADEGSFLMEKSVVKSILRRLYGLEGCSCYREGFSEECHSMVYITDKRERF